MTLSTTACYVILVLTIWTAISFIWWWLARNRNYDEGHWYDWVLGIPVLSLAGIIGIAQIIFIKNK